MYQLKNALTLGKTIGAQWDYRDLSDVFVYAGYQEFKKVYLILTHTSGPEVLYVDMDDVRQEAYSFNGSFAQWVAQLGNQSVPFTANLPNAKIRYAKYANALQAGYEINLGNAGLYYEAGVNARNFTDVKLTRNKFKTDMELINDYCLMTVNGFFHDHVGNQTETFILKGGKTGFKSQETQIGIYSFLDVGKLNKIKINPLKIASTDVGGSFYERLRFEVDFEVGDKPYFLIMGGYMIFPKENIFFQTGPSTFSLALNQLHYEERIMESDKFIDLSELELSAPNMSPNGYDLAQLRSDETIAKYLSMSNSYLVVVDAPMLAVERHVIQRAAFPGQFLHYEDPVYPVIGAHGRFLDYWKIEEGNMWSINCTDTFSRNFVYPEGARERAKYTLASLDVTRRYEHTQAYMLEISTNKE